MNKGNNLIRIHIFTFFVITIVACQKVEPIPIVDDSLVFTATIGKSQTKTTIDADQSSLMAGKVSWEATDTITIRDNANNTAVYKIVSITDGRALFKYKSGDILGVGPYSAEYGSIPAQNQTYSEIPRDLPMTAVSSSTSLSFNVSCGLLKVTLRKANETVSSINVTGTPDGGTETTYTLICDEVQSIDTDKDFFIALPAGSYGKFVFTNKDKVSCIKIAMVAHSTIIYDNVIHTITFSTSLSFTESFFTINGSSDRYDFTVGTVWYDYVNAHPGCGFSWRKSGGTAEYLCYNDCLLIYGNQKIKKTVAIIPGADYCTY